MARCRRCPHLLAVCLLLVLVITNVASRQLESDVEAQQLNRNQKAETSIIQQLQLSYKQALANSSCHGFLVGIGTQKGVCWEGL
jgi:hypothetical protein